MTKKESRLSPKARKLLEVARTKFSAQPEKAVRYLMSVDPSELTVYDRQKIGREILVRSRLHRPPQPEQLFFDKYQITPGLGLGVSRGSKKLKGDRGYERPGRIEIVDMRKNPYKYSLKFARTFEREREYGRAFASYLRAGIEFKNANKLDEAVECYDLAESMLQKSPETQRNLSYSSPQRVYLRELEQLKKERSKRKPGLETTLAAIAIVGLLGGIFFLSDSITGNVTGLNQNSSNVIGIIFLFISLAGGFLFLRKKKTFKP
ncbi:MAG: LPXTG cell wall anchor domain-containing protein [Candidatus Pacearchaeota archaeon]|jgi:LPXTG-motif cell wall-anchored protein